MTMDQFLKACEVSSLDEVLTDLYPRIPSSVIDDLRPFEWKGLEDPDWITADEFQDMMDGRRAAKERLKAREPTIDLGELIRQQGLENRKLKFGRSVRRRRK